MLRTVKVNDQLLRLDDAAVVRSIPLRSGGAVDVAFKNFATEKGTLVTVRSPDISLAVYLVRAPSLSLSLSS